MRYMKGMKIEVVNLMDTTSSESWRPAEIVSGNGRTYHVIYDGCSPDAVRVPRKAIRPCPPPVMGLTTWREGDGVEVFEDNSWKVGVVVGEVDGGCFSVMVLGGSMVIKARGCHVRVRQTWENDRWVTIDKVHEKCGVQVIDNPSKSRKYLLQKPEPRPEVKNVDDSVHYQVSSRGMKKRRLISSPIVETCDRTGRKRRAVGGMEGRGLRQIVKGSYPAVAKVDAVVSPHIMFGENYMHASLDCNATAFPELEMDRKLNAQLNVANTTCSIVDSCSTNGRQYLPLYHPITTSTQDSDGACSCVLGRNQFLPILAGPGEEIHQLELYAYRSTILAFHASGPLTWEKVELLTDLRRMLHISNDEHSLELRHLLSVNR